VKWDVWNVITPEHAGRSSSIWNHFRRRNFLYSSRIRTRSNSETWQVSLFWKVRKTRIAAKILDLQFFLFRRFFSFVNFLYFFNKNPELPTKYWLPKRKKFSGCQTWIRLEFGHFILDLCLLYRTSESLILNWHQVCIPSKSFFLECLFYLTIARKSTTQRWRHVCRSIKILKLIICTKITYVMFPYSFTGNGK